MNPVEILCRLPPEDRAGLMPYLAPSVARSWRISARDTAVRAAMDALQGTSVYPRACELERRLTRYLAGAAWKLEHRLETLSPDAPELSRHLHTIARLNEGDGLGWSAIQQIYKNQPRQL